MKPDFHRMKAERIARSMQKLTDADYETIIEACMLAGTHWFNFARHRMAIAGSERDIMHAEYLDGAQRVEISLLEPSLLSALDEIEGYRAGFVRGDMEGGQGIAARCRNLLDTIRSAALGSTPRRSATSNERYGIG
jgi:hypothetical protein